jgi:MYXO-CTERM domain-containing protein
VSRLGLSLACLLLVPVAICLAARPAAAQTGGSGVLTGAGGGTGTTLSGSDFFIGVQHEAGTNLRDFEVKRFFNKANCDCSEPVFLYFALQPSGLQKRNLVNKSGNVEFWIGSDCTNTVTRVNNCRKLKTQLQTAFLNVGHDTIATNARIMSTDISAAMTTGFPTDGNPTCTLTSDSGSMNIFVIIDANSDGIPDSGAYGSSSVLVDLKAPPSPDSNGITVEGGDEALVVRWPKVDQALYTDLLGYQLLCNRGGSLQVFPEGSFDPGFLSCTGANPAGGVEALDPLYVCSPLLSPTTSSYRVKILQNDITYGVAVVSVDQSRNASTPDIFYGVPNATKSFYDVYRNGHEGAMEPDGGIPGGAEGGFCAVAPVPRSGHATLYLGGLGLSVAGLAAFVRRRRRP